MSSRTQDAKETGSEERLQEQYEFAVSRCTAKKESLWPSVPPSRAHCSSATHLFGPAAATCWAAETSQTTACLDVAALFLDSQGLLPPTPLIYAFSG